MTTLAANQPSWLDEPCPTWCTRAHTEEDHVEDRRHQGDGSIVPLARLLPTGECTFLEVAIYLDQPLGAEQPWVRVEATESVTPRMALSLDSARRLAGHLDDAARVGDKG